MLHKINKGLVCIDKCQYLIACSKVTQEPKAHSSFFFLSQELKKEQTTWFLKTHFQKHSRVEDTQRVEQSLRVKLKDTWSSGICG